MKLQFLFDIGGTHFRSGISYNKTMKFTKEQNKFSSFQEIIDYMKKYINTNIKTYSDYKSACAVIAIAGIVENNCVISASNLSFLDNKRFPDKIENIPLFAINDADASILGEISYNHLNSSKNILSLIFGTGVGSGLWINNCLVLNSEADGLFEKYLSGTVFDEDNPEKMYKKFKKSLKNVIEFLNIDIVVINGFIKQYDIFKNINEDIEVRPYFKDKLEIIFSECVEPVIYGCSTNFTS
jgi:predicted NBD/HSP70 family sugar kinase